MVRNNYFPVNKFVNNLLTFSNFLADTAESNVVTFSNALSLLVFVVSIVATILSWRALRKKSELDMSLHVQKQNFDHEYKIYKEVSIEVIELLQNSAILIYEGGDGCPLLQKTTLRISDEEFKAGKIHIKRFDDSKEKLRKIRIGNSAFIPTEIDEKIKEFWSELVRGTMRFYETRPQEPKPWDPHSGELPNFADAKENMQFRDEKIDKGYYPNYEKWINENVTPRINELNALIKNRIWLLKNPAKLSDNDKPSL